MYSSGRTDLVFIPLVLNHPKSSLRLFCKYSDSTFAFFFLFFAYRALKMKTSQESQHGGLLSFLSSGLCWLENGEFTMLISVGILKFCKLIHFLSEVEKGGRAKPLLILFSSISLCGVGKCLQKQQPSAFLNSRNKQKCGDLLHSIFYTYLPEGPCQLIQETLRPHCPPP